MKTGYHWVGMIAVSGSLEVGLVTHRLEWPGFFKRPCAVRLVTPLTAALNRRFYQYRPRNAVPKLQIGRREFGFLLPFERTSSDSVSTMDVHDIFPSRSRSYLLDNERSLRGTAASEWGRLF